MGFLYPASRIATIVCFAVAGAFSFFAIIGVFGLMEAILGLVVFAAAALLSFHLNPAETMES